MSKILEVTQENLSLYPQVICFINPKNEYYGLKIAWLKDRFKEGLTIKLAQNETDQKIIGFIEYIPSAYAWRGVTAKDYLFVHCIWVSPNKNKNQGLGSALINEVIKDTKTQKLNGVAVITSDGSFMAKKDLFLKNGFELIEEKNDMQLLVKNFGKEHTLPHLNYDENALAKYQGWHIIYSRQCPWVARFIEEVKPILKQEGLKVNFEEITTATQAQKAPGIYATFNLIKDGKLLADRYISTTRFKNILKQNK